MGKYLGVGVVLMMVALSTVALGKTESLPELIARADAAKPDQQPDLYLDVAERELKALNDSYAASRWDEFLSELQEVVKYCDKAHAAAIHSRKHVKKAEIRIRKIVSRLRDIKLNVQLDDQAQVQAAIDRLETFRTELLESMFGSKGND